MLADKECHPSAGPPWVFKRELWTELGGRKILSTTLNPQIEGSKLFLWFSFLLLLALVLNIYQSPVCALIFILLPNYSALDTYRVMNDTQAG